MLPIGEREAIRRTPRVELRWRKCGITLRDCR